MTTTTEWGLPRDVVVKMARVVGEQLTAHRANGESEAMPERDLADAFIGAKLEELATKAASAGRAPMPSEVEHRLADAVRAQLFGVGPVQTLLDDETISDIHINRYDIIWVKRRNGQREQMPSPFRSEEELRQWIAAQARHSRIEQRFDYAAPLLDMRMGDGSRLNASGWVSTSPTVVIRRHDWSINRLTDMVRLGVCTQVVARLLSAMVQSGRNVLVSGGTGTGKTTLLRCLLNEVPSDVRIVTIEDSLELGLSKWPELHGNVVEMEARSPNLEGEGGISLRALVRNALRQDPDRIVVGEARGGEVIDLLTAMSTNQAGSMASIHADSSANALRRIQTYAAVFGDPPVPTEYCQELIRDSVHFVVHLGWVQRSRRVVSIREVDRHVRDGGLNSNEVFELGPDDEAVASFGISDHGHREALAEHGFDVAQLNPGRLQ